MIAFIAVFEGVMSLPNLVVIIISYKHLFLSNGKYEYFKRRVLGDFH